MDSGKNMKTISQFHAMNPEYSEYTDGNHMYSMTGVNPLYYMSDGTVQEKQVSPLTASYYPGSISSTINARVIQILPSGTTNVSTPNVVNFDAFILTETLHVYGVSVSGGLTDLGSPLSSNIDQGARLAVGNNGKLVFISNNSQSIFTLPLSDGSTAQSSTWTNSGAGPGDYFPTGVRGIEPFQNYIAITSRAAIGVGTASIIRLYPYNTVFSTTAQGSMDLGQGWQILRLQNFANKYIVAGAYYSSNKLAKGGQGTTSDSNISYLFFWNGNITTTTRYQFAVKVPGTFIDMIYSYGTLYVLVLERAGRYGLYKYSGGDTLKKVFNLQYDIPNLYAGNALFAYPDGVGINFLTKGLYIYTHVNGKEFRFIPTFTNQTPADSVCISTNGTLYTANISNLLYLPESYPGTGTYFNDIDATTQWVPVNTKLTSINVWYESKPLAVGDYIRITATSWSEDQADGTVTQLLSDITSTQFDTAIRTTLDLKGLTGTMLKLRIQTHSTGSWRPIIRKIEINEAK